MKRIDGIPNDLIYHIERIGNIPTVHIYHLCERYKKESDDDVNFSTVYGNYTLDLCAKVQKLIYNRIHVIAVFC